MNNPKKQPNKWLQFITIPFQMGFIIFIGALLGVEIDNYLGSHPVFLVIMVLGAIAISFYYIFKQLESINKNNE